MANSIPYVLGAQTITFYVDGKGTQVARDHAQFDKILAAVAAGDAARAIELAKPAVAIAAALDESSDEFAKWFRRASVRVEVSDYGVTVNGEPIHGVLVDRLMEVRAAGLPIDSWIRFVGKVYQNPSSTSRDELYLFLEKAELPITADGDFLAYKRVRPDYKDIHSGKFDNSVGQVVQMNRLDVDDDRNRTCSAGLHFCSKGYLPHFSSYGDTDHVMVVKINPADVVSIPADYANTKGRTWRYEVVGEIDLAEAIGSNPWGSPVVGSYGDREFDVDYEDDGEVDDVFVDADDDELSEYDRLSDEYKGRESEGADRALIGKVFAAYASKYGVTAKGEPERSARLFRTSQFLGEIIESFNDLTVEESLTLINEWTD